MSEETMRRGGRSSIWRQRRRRYATGLNVLLATLLAAAVFAMVNFIAYRYFDVRWDIGARRYYELSDKTRGLLGSLRSPVTVVAFFQQSRREFDDVRQLLLQYEYAAARLDVDLQVEFVDPDRDLSRARELARKYEVSEDEANVIVFSCEGRRKFVPAASLVDYQITLSGRTVSKRLIGFKGEQAFSSAIQSVVQMVRPTVYFLAGHGEHDVEDSSPQTGYTRLARLIRNDNVEIKPLLLAGQRGIPDDCAALVIAGPDRRISLAETDILANYLKRNGRLLLLLDAGVTSGLEDLLVAWGVRVSQDLVVGELSLTGRDLVVNQYGDHPITRNLNNVTTMFLQPRSVEPAESVRISADDVTDKARVTALALSGNDSWAESDIGQSPAQFDKDADRLGPVSIAVAVEKGPPGGIDMELKPTRMVVIGESDFLCNAALESGVGGNVDFLLSSLNWILERDALLAIAPKAPGELNLDANGRQLAAALLVVIGALPAAAVALGLLVWLWRRR
jgi:ABC-type uncharacterized transport system involved in gliding motility auxiliary subunit